MNKYEKKVRRKITRMKPCPFCGQVPIIEARVDKKHSAHGSIGHFANQIPCCKIFPMGRTELFFCNDYKAPDYALWKNMIDRFVDHWNKRQL